jgi:hypothetical protein
MRFLIVLVALLSSVWSAAAQNNVRYFSGVYGLLDDVETDAFLKETRAGNKVVSAELDLCHALSPGSPLRDRVVVTLKPQDNRLVGSGQSQDAKTPVSVDLVRTGSGDTFSFEGSVKYGNRTFKASSGDVTDMSAKDFQEQTAVEETIIENPANFHDVTPNTIAFRVNRPALVDFLKSLRADNVKVQAYSIAPSCEALRRGHFHVQAEVDPERAQDVIAKAKSVPGVTRAGWTSGGIDLSRSIRFPAAEWRDASGKLDREKLGKTVAAVTAKALSGEQDAIEWDDVTGELGVLVKRPDVTVPGLGLTEVIGAPFVFSSEKPGAKDMIVIRIGRLDSEIQDPGAGPRLQINTTQSDGDSSEPAGSDSLQAALAKELKGQIWDTDKETWAK